MEIASSIEFENKQGRISFELLITPCVAQHNNFDKSTTSTYKKNAAEVSHDSGPNQEFADHWSGTWLPGFAHFIIADKSGKNALFTRGRGDLP